MNQALPPGWVVPDPIPRRPAPGYEYAGFWRRFWAYWIDSMLLSIPLTLLGLVVFGNTITAFFSTSPIQYDPATRRYIESPEFIAGLGGLLASFARTFVLSWIAQVLYFATCWSRLGASLGQKLLGVEVRTEQTGTWIGFRRGCVRTLGYLVSGIILDLGFIWAAFDPRKQGWHDKIAGTVVIRRSGQDSRAGPFVVIFVVIGLLAVSIPITAFAVSLRTTVLPGSSLAPVPSLGPTSTAVTGLYQVGSTSQPVAEDIWFGSSFDPKTMAMSGRATTFPRNQPIVFVAHTFTLFGGRDSVSVHWVAAAEDHDLEEVNFPAGGNLVGDKVPASAMSQAGTVRFEILDSGGVTMATGWFTVQ